VRSIPVSKIFLILLGTTFFFVVLSSSFVTYQFAHYSSEASKQAQNLQDTSILNLELRHRVNEQINLVYRQFDGIELSFPDKFSAINFEVGEKQTRYLKLKLGTEERLTVERIKDCQAELGIEAMHIYHELQAGDRSAALKGLRYLEDLENRINTEFANLNNVETEKLRVVQNQLSTTAGTTYLAIFGLAAYLFASLIIFILLLRRRVLQPLRWILDATNRVRQGDFSARAPEQREDELGELAQAFNFMAASLAESYAGLENKVIERTRQLETLQQQLIQSEKMSAVGRMLSGVAHELNNPLTVIMGKTELAMRRLRSAGINSGEIQLMEELHDQGERCRKIVASLLQFARQEKPRYELVRLTDVIDQALKLREHELTLRNVKIVREFDPENPKFCADPNKIAQVILNLVNNADDAISETGRPGTILVRTRAEGESVHIDFFDDAAGLREPERVFDPFYTTKEVGQGTGLGLSVCYGIIEEHGGTIRAENWEHGARFSIVLPIGDLHLKCDASVKTEEPSPPLERFKALVVDDEEPLVSLQIDFLSDIGVDAVGVNSGSDAIDYLEANTVDLVVSDVRMPGAINGIQLYEWVQRNRPDLADNFIFVSGDMIGMNGGEFFLKSKARRIQKPFLWDDYSNLVKETLVGEQAL
jgi:signal transduction histidine kinase/CheY-like chemotaxis protein